MERRARALWALAALSVASAEEHSRHLRSGAQTQIGEVKAHSPFIDDLEPVAPLDAVAAPGAVAAAGIPRQGGARRPALYVPPYLYPDAFPASAKDICHCDAPKEEKLTKEEELWAAEVAKQLNLPLSQVMHPTDFKGIAHCDCGAAEKADGRVFRYVKTQATNSSGFTVAGADPTFPHGSYWEPEAVDASGLMAPADQLRPEDLPPQAPFDEVDLASNLAQHDKIPKKIAKYLDQVESRSSNCDDPTKPCSADCSAGDAVSFELGNTRRAATVLATAAGNALEIEFATGLAAGDVCAAEAGCSLFRVCAPKPGLGAAAPRQCVAQDSDERLSWQGHIERHFQCPENTAGCKRVRQVVQGLYLRKEGKPCRAR